MSLIETVEDLVRIVKELGISDEKLLKIVDVIRMEHYEQKKEMISLRGKVNQLINLLPKEEQKLFNFL